MDPTTINTTINQLQCCVIIPTYNNDKTLENVIDGVLKHTQDVIVVNDGSTDYTSQILNKYPQIEIIHISKNEGKGNALDIGFKQALSRGFKFAITIDSDGQHFPKDIAVFIDALESEENKNVLFIGNRNMEQDGIPKKSSFGHKFSNFWFWVETGTWSKDTQSGYRLYPLKEIEKLKLYTKKFEFEIEVIVKLAWRGTLIKNVPIDIVYEETDRVSHFRPFKDFTRISILNTWLVIVAFLYIKPRNFFRKINKKGIKQFINEDLLGSNDSPKKMAFSIALGVFIGLSPFWGFHTIIVIFLAVVLKLNKTISFAFSNVSLPPFIPFIVYASLVTGQYVLGVENIYSMGDMIENLEVLKQLKIYLVGSFSLATVSAIILGVFGYLVLSIFKRPKRIVENE